MAVVLILISALAASLVGVFSKLASNEKVDSTLSTALKISVMLVISFVCMLFSDGLNFTGLNGKMWLLAVASGISCVITWLCFFKAVEIGEMLRVVAIDKSSVVFVLIYSVLFFNEDFTVFSAVGISLVLVGIALITIRAFRTSSESLSEPSLKHDTEKSPRKNPMYLVLAFAAAFTVSLMTLFAKLGLDEMDTNTSTFLRTAVSVSILWAVVFFKKSQGDVRLLNGRDWILLVITGIVTAVGWLTFYPAIAMGDASVIVSLDKISVVFAMIWSALILKEKPDALSIAACFAIVAGAVFLVL